MVEIHIREASRPFTKSFQLHSVQLSFATSAKGLLATDDDLPVPMFEDANLVTIRHNEIMETSFEDVKECKDKYERLESII